MIRITGSSTVELRNPVFGDMFRFDTNAEIRRTRVGELKYCRPGSLWTWNTETLSLTIVRITQTKMLEFRALMIADAAKEFVLTRLEWPTTIWSYAGYITTPLLDIIRVRPPCSYDISFDFRARV